MIPYPSWKPSIQINDEQPMILNKRGIHSQAASLINIRMLFFISVLLCSGVSKSSIFRLYRGHPYFSTLMI